MSTQKPTHRIYVLSPTPQQQEIKIYVTIWLFIWPPHHGAQTPWRPQHNIYINSVILQNIVKGCCSIYLSEKFAFHQKFKFQSLGNFMKTARVISVVQYYRNGSKFDPSSEMNGMRAMRVCVCVFFSPQFITIINEES